MRELKKIASFTIDHDRLTPGLYLSRQDGDIATYDLRFKRPNTGDFLDAAAMHTLEHLGATFVRSGRLADRVVYFGPMGCRTGFYLLLRDVPPQDAVALVREMTAFAAGYSGGIPGAAAAECGNYLEHDLASAKREAAAYLNAVKDWDASKLSYPK